MTRSSTSLLINIGLNALTPIIIADAMFIADRINGEDKK